jgi:hypothetical protein
MRSKRATKFYTCGAPGVPLFPPHLARVREWRLKEEKIQIYGYRMWSWWTINKIKFSKSRNFSWIWGE